MDRIVAFLVLILFPLGVNGHPGGTDAHGCHHDQRKNEHHCHEKAKPQTFSGKVVGVLDGDTIEVLNQGRSQRVRLSEIDSPEKNQPFGKKAKQYTSEMVFGKDVTVQSSGKDKYGRTLGEVYLQNGTNVNHELVRQGMAWQYRQYSNSSRLRGLESEARQEKRGLWREADPTPPWEFRRDRRLTGEDLIPKKRQPATKIK